MWTTSPEFDAALHRKSRAWAAKVEVLYQGDKVTLDNIMVEGVVDFGPQAVRRAAKIRIIDKTGTLTPVSAKDLLAPKGTEILLHKGLFMPDTEVFEFVPLGVFGITEPRIERLPGGGVAIELDASDRAALVKSRRFIDPWVVKKNTLTHRAITDIVVSRFLADLRVQVTGHTTPEVVYDALSDPWAAIADLSQADSLTSYFDPVGSFVVARDEPVHTGITYKGGEDSLLIDVKRVITAENTYSGVVVRVEHPDRDPIVATAWDNDPRSPTYADGPFGKRPFGFTTHLITTAAQAQLAANTLLPKVTRMRQTVEILTAGHPGHDVGDLITVEDHATKTRGEWIVQGGAVSLRPGAPTKLVLTEATSNFDTLGRAEQREILGVT